MDAKLDLASFPKSVFEGFRVQNPDIAAEIFELIDKFIQNFAEYQERILL